MKEKENQFEKIEKFLSGEMSEDELRAFQAEMDRDDDLRREVLLHHEIAEASQEDDVIEFREKLKEIIKDRSAKTGRKVSRIQRWIPYAAAAVIFLVIGFFYFNRKSDSVEIFMDYYEPYPNILAIRTGQELTKRDLGLAAYAEKDYEKAISYFEESEAQSDTLVFYHGLSYLSLERPLEAISKFDDIQDQSIFSQQAQWYKGLAFLLNKDRDSAKEVFSSIQSNEFNYEESRQILDQL